MAEEDDESWQEFFDNNRLILPHPSKRATETQKQAITGFCLTIKNIEGLHLPQSLTSVIEPNSVQFQLRITFFDTANKYFYGGTWLSDFLDPSSSSNDRFKIDCEEALYFHSSLNDYTCVAAIEVTAFGKNDQGYSLGWTFIRVFDRVNELRDISTPPSIQRQPIYHGSLGVLVYLPTQDGLEDYIDNQKVDGCFVCYSLQTHPSMDKVFHLMPENVLIGGDDIVPGISESNVDDSSIIDILKKPKLLKTFPCFINKLSVYLEPSIEEFEEQMLEKLNQDRLHRSNISPDDGLTVTVVERRLRVGVHNGWTFVSEPHVVYLEPEYEGGGSKSGRKSPSPSQGSLRSAASKILCLVLRSRLELVELVQHSLFAVVFEIEYVISEPYTQPLIETKKKKPSLSGSLMRSHKQTVTVQFAVWTPFEEGLLDEKEITLDMDHGALLYPGMKMVYKTNKSPQVKVAGKIKFTFTQQRKRAGSMKSSPHGSQLMPPGQATPHRLSTSSLTHGAQSSTPYSSLGIIDKDVDQTAASLMPGITGRPPLPGRGRTVDNSLVPKPFQSQGPIGTRPSPPQPSSNLTEVPHIQYHTPLLLSNTAGLSSGTSTLTRAGYAQLSGAGYESISDRHGNPPLVVDPAEVVPMNIDHEVTDSLQANEIVIQFLAVSRCFAHRSVFFTFQFYRFPQVTTERLYLKGSETENQGQLSILQKFTKNDMVSNEAAGLVLKYLVDPAFMQEGESKVFGRYLLAQTMHMDVWDGDTLLLIGSASLELKHLLRQGREAVLVSHELDVVSVDYSENSPTMVGDVTRTGAVQPVGMETSIKAKLHLRMANIGHHSEMPTARLGTVPRKRSHVIMSETITGTMNGLGSTTAKAKCKAKLLAECDAELAAVLFSRQGKVNKDDKPVNEVDAVRQRKLQRMQAVRQTSGMDSNAPLILKKEEKLQRARDLKTIQLYRDKNKHEGILSLLAANITTNYTIYPSFGTAEFFEFAIKNPYDTEQNISVQCDDKEVTVITDTREWRHFKKFVDKHTPIEENMFNKTKDTTFPTIFLRPRESVHIPFKYQTFRADHSVPDQTPSHSLKQQNTTPKKIASVQDNKLQSRNVKVCFMMKDDRPMAVLNLNVEPRPHVVDQTLRFYHPEQSFLKRSIRMPPWHSLPGAPVIDEETPPKVHVRCSDVNAVCEARTVNSTEPQDIFLKIACGPSPSIKRFYVLMYTDPFMASPCQTWQFYVHSLQRVDISAIEGQSNRLSVILRGTQSSRLVRCYSSHPEELQVTPSDPIMLMANAVQEVTLTLTPLSSGGTRNMQVNVVDTEFHQLVRTWLVCASCQQPAISKAFELHLQVGGGKGSNKRVSFTNPYPSRKVFHLKCNRPDLLQFKDNSIEVGPGESKHIGMKFSPQQTAGTQHLMIFINDPERKNEETFSITAVYR